MDCLQELLQRWYSPENIGVIDDNDDDMSGDINLRRACLDEIGFQPTGGNNQSSFPQSWLDKSPITLQLYRFILCILTRDTNEEIKSCAQLWLTSADQLIQLRHLERCYRLFLQSSVQRQARDCLLVSRMATLTLNVFKPSTLPTTPLLATNNSASSSSVNINTSITTQNKSTCYVQDLLELAEKVRLLAMQLYIHRFHLPAEDIVNQVHTCPICTENILL
ncbi:unnamed protein product [Trichobilharzia regenti]|nr:unnamed protein product [Trichobilharzia regenti]